MTNNLFWHQKVFIILLYASLVLYGLSLVAYFGLNLKPYSLILDRFVKLYIGLMLVIKFNPITRTNNFTEFDKRLAYHAGMILLLTTIMSWLLGIGVISENKNYLSIVSSKEGK
tara:strand:+ start:347 stop:688 length:342 start_codon:yes stop_codon:yes gene_type:complete